MVRKKIVIIGAGNVATHLARALDATNDVIAVYSRNISNAEILSQTLHSAKACNDLSALPCDADYYIISVKDDAIRSVAENTSINSGIWAHTSGSVPADVFKGLKSNYGVFYPLQTFNRTKDVDVQSVPMFIEGNSPEVTGSLISLAKSISSKVSKADSTARKRFHLAAVFACNFVNYLWSIADDILHDGGYDLSILEPLMKITLENAVKYGPENVQTGPAKRGDTHIIQSQMESLEDDKKREIYKVITDAIISKYNK